MKVTEEMQVENHGLKCSVPVQMDLPGNRMGTAEFPAEFRAEEDGTVTLSFSSERPVTRWGDNEILLHEPGAADFSRLSEVGAILRNHDPDQVVGVPVRVWLDESAHKGRLTMRFGTTEQAQNAKKEVEDGTLRGVSVGYRINEARVLNEGEKWGRFTGPAYVATKWEALEASLTPVPADPSVGVGRAIETTPTKETETMKKEKEIDSAPAVETPAAPAAEARTVTPPAVEQPAAPAADLAKAERERCANITAVCQKRGVDPTPYIERGDDLTTVYRSLLDEDAGKPAQVEITRDGRDSFRDAAVESLKLRAGTLKGQPKNGGEELRGLTLMELARESLRRAGLSTAGEKLDVARRALAGGWRKEDITAGTSDFPAIMAASASDTLEAEYRDVPTHYREWCLVGSVPDFKEAKRVEISDIGQLDEIPEFGHYPSAQFGDRKETVSIVTYGKIFGLSRQAIINDELDAFMRIPRAFARAAARLPQTLALKKLLSNPTLQKDNVAVFAAGHGNLLTGAGYALDTLAHAAAGMKNARALMFKQREWTVDGVDGAFLDIYPRIILCNADDEYNAGAVISSTANVDGSNSGIRNPIRDWGLRYIVDQNLANESWSGTSTNWFMLADPREAPVIEVNFLNGNDAPFMEEADQTNVDGRYWKVRLDCGADAIGYRGAVKITGAN